MNIKTKITGVQHIGIPTNDMHASILFYESIGFDLTWKTTNKVTDEKVTFLQLKNLVVEIYEGKQVAMTSGAIDHIALDVKDIDAVFQFIQKLQYTILEQTVQYLPFWQNGVKFFTICGPNKEKIEFCEKLEL